MRKITLIVFIFAVCCVNIHAQISEGGNPPSFAYSNKLKSVKQPYSAISNADLKEVLWQDSISEKNGSPTRIATIIPVDIDINKTGEWTTLPNKQRIWRQTIQSPNAEAIILSYKDFYIPDGAKLFIYGGNKEQVIGAYTEKTNPQGGAFSTEMIYGDELTLEYVESATSIEEARIEIKKLGYVYPKTIDSPTTRATYPYKLVVGRSQSCEININCTEGNGWRDQQRGVVHIAMEFSDGWYICSGSLVNNTANDGSPYILSATHCFFDGNKTASFATAQFYFSYEHSGCSKMSTVPATLKSLVASDLKVTTSILSSSDGLLLKLRDNVPTEWNPYYNGWDINDIAAGSGVIIHHPNGDVKKISTYTQAPTNSSWNDNANGFAKNTHWKIYYAATTNGKGVSEGGSSGSPMFNQDKLIVGTLSGGESFCINQSGGGPTYPDVYGKMAYHWDKDSNPDQRMQIYLDPLNKGVKTLLGYDPNKQTGIEAKKSKTVNLIIFPNPTEDELNINTQGIIESIKIFNLLGQSIYSVDDIKSSSHSMPTSTWMRGIYNVVVETEKGVFTERMIKK